MARISGKAIGGGLGAGAIFKLINKLDDADVSVARR
jgi:hypothetical protein